MIKRLAIPVFICVCLVGTAWAVHLSMVEEARALVEDAAAFLREKGRDAAIAELSRRDGRFVKGDLYVFAYDLNGVMVAHPVNPSLVGRNMLKEPDSKGKLFRKMIVDLAVTVGSGWVDYTYLNPVRKKEEAKTTYFLKEDDLILCCGAYSVPPPFLGG